MKTTISEMGMFYIAFYYIKIKDDFVSNYDFFDLEFR